MKGDLENGETHKAFYDNATVKFHHPARNLLITFFFMEVPLKKMWSYRTDIVRGETSNKFMFNVEEKQKCSRTWRHALTLLSECYSDCDVANLWRPRIGATVFNFPWF